MDSVHAGDKRPAPPAVPDQTVPLDGVRAVVVDVEGTTSPASFTKEVLVPYTKEHIKSFLDANFDSEDLLQAIDKIRTKLSADKEAGAEGVVVIPTRDAAKEEIITAVVTNVLSKIDSDAQSSELRPLLELVWKDGYKSDLVQGEVYDDVVPVLRQIMSDGIKVYSYCADSVESQKLLFGFTNQGDVSEIFSRHFDLSVGGKTEKESYAEIAKELGLPPAEVLYITHCPLEASAADAAGVKTCVVVREGNAALTDEQLQATNVIYGLDELLDDSDPVPAKRPHHGGGGGGHYPPDDDEYVSTDGGATNDSDYGGGHGVGHGGEEEDEEGGRGGDGAAEQD